MLRLAVQPPDVSPMPRVTRVPTRGEVLAIFGFPRGHGEGVWKFGLKRTGPLIGGWAQLDAGDSVGYKLQRGFSGCPLIAA